MEYVRRRRVLRLVAWSKGNMVVRPVELPIRSLFERLGVDPDEVAAPRQWLLFGGTEHRARGGASDLVGTFGTEAEARAAFRELREHPPSDGAWAELVVLDQAGRTKPVSWFGRPAPLRAVGVSGRRAWDSRESYRISEHRTRRTFWRRRGRHPDAAEG